MYEIFEKLCKENNVSAYKVAKETGVTTATLTSWKQGKYVPKREKIDKLAEYFHVSSEYIMTGKEDNLLIENTKDMENASVIGSIIYDTQLLDMVKKIQKMSVTQRDLLSKLIDEMTNIGA